MIGWIGDIEATTLEHPDGTVHRSKAEAEAAEHDHD
jgi:hypothetical protein